MMGGKSVTKEYVNIKGSTFPTNGVVNNRNSLFAYVNARQDAGTMIHFAFDVSNVPDTVTHIDIVQQNINSDANRVARHYPPFSHIDDEFTLTRFIDYMTIFFSENVSNVSITNIVLEKIIIT